MADQKADDNRTNIIIYTTPTCGFCHMVKEYFKNKDIEFETKDITQDETAYKDVLDKSGQMGVPVIEMGDKIIIGFDRPKIDLQLREMKLV